jgi:hypothetical protein
MDLFYNLVEPPGGDRIGVQWNTFITTPADCRIKRDFSKKLDV